MLALCFVSHSCTDSASEWRFGSQPCQVWSWWSLSYFSHQKPTRKNIGLYTSHGWPASLSKRNMSFCCSLGSIQNERESFPTTKNRWKSSATGKKKCATKNLLKSQPQKKTFESSNNSLHSPNAHRFFLVAFPALKKKTSVEFENLMILSISKICILHAQL